MTLNDFDRIASVYDLLARLVFGKSMVKAQIHFLPKIPAHAKVLILGGGTGWILTELFRMNPLCKVWYVEASAKMLALSRKRVNDEWPVKFIHGTEENIPLSMDFDVVITNFYLDLFNENALNEVVVRIKSALNVNSIWIATDFVNNQKLWQRVTLRIMYLFFQLACNIESTQLPAWKTAIQKTKYKKEEIKSFYGAFIETVWFTN